MQLLYPTRGHARILGRPVGDVAVRQRIGFLAENPYYYDYLTAEELLTYFARLFGYRGADVTDARGPRARRGRALAPSGACGCASSRKACCSASGWRRRSSTIPKWCFSTSRCRGSIRWAAAQVRDLILRLRDRGCTVFFSSHILSDAEALCSRVAILAQGRLVASGQLSDILASS